ncbi:hypothetical protein [Pelagibacterium luteolum]|uniref:Uncharacterized protein n=1 Tax=Pelagibacterium luteolum TaxID=440168 RepID=A0A1G7TIX5_9HYPH|nr:hypothetical protein [Pelagibacterium luteolum]SDG35286.1 hypothetical protein SAMN04487974_102158 [Pelagibacterium luteolum]
MSDFQHFDFDPRHIPDEYAIALGRVSLAWSQTESVLEDAIAGVAGIGAFRGWAITTHMNLNNRIDTLLALIRLGSLDSKLQSEIESAIKDIRKAADDRNRFVHSYWATDERDGKVYLTSKTARGALKPKAQSVSTTEVTDAAMNIYLSGLRLLQLLNANGLLPDPSY